jgi:Spy/CpxP family protein refolding chaperone
MKKTMTHAALAIVGIFTAVCLTTGGYLAAQGGDGQPPATARRGGPGGPGRFGGPGGPGPLMPMLVNRLNLTDSQKEQVKNILNAHREETRALADRARAAHQAVEEAVAAETFNEGTVRARAADAAAVDADMAVARANVYAQVLQILTADQKTQLRQLQEKMKVRRGRGPRTAR